MLFLWEDLNLRHSTTDHCTWGEDQKCQRTEEEEAREGDEPEVKTYGQPLTMVSLFSYLGRNLMAIDNDWMEVVLNLLETRWAWAHL